MANQTLIRPDDRGFSALWWHPNCVLQSLNAGRVPYFIEQLDRLAKRDNRNRSEVKVLDVGCGGGLVTEPLARAGFQMVGLDISPRSIAAAEAHAAGAKVDALDGDVKQAEVKIDYIVGSAYKLPFDDASFDAVLSSDVAEQYLRPRLVNLTHSVCTIYALTAARSLECSSRRACSRSTPSIARRRYDPELCAS